MFVAPGDGRAGQWGRWNLNPARPWWCEGKVNVVNLVNCRPAQGNNSSRLRSPSSLLVTPHFWHVSSFDVSEALIYIFAPGYCCAHSKFSFCHIPSCPFFWSASTRPCHQLRSLIQGQEIQVLPHWDADCSRILRTLVSFLLPLILFCCKKHIYIYTHTHLQTHTHTHTHFSWRSLWICKLAFVPSSRCHHLKADIHSTLSRWRLVIFDHFCLVHFTC